MQLHGAVSGQNSDSAVLTKQEVNWARLAGLSFLGEKSAVDKNREECVQDSDCAVLTIQEVSRAGLGKIELPG